MPIRLYQLFHLHCNRKLSFDFQGTWVWVSTKLSCLTVRASENCYWALPSPSFQFHASSFCASNERDVYYHASNLNWSDKLLRNLSCKIFDMNEISSIKKILCQKWRQVSAFALLKCWMLDISHWTENPITWLLIRCIFFNWGEKRPSETRKSTGKLCQLEQLKEDMEFLIFTLG